jgi:putative transposase
MARLARIVAVGYPHHIIQRGNRGQQTFFRDKDYNDYVNLIKEWCGESDVAIWAYCLMPNHVHFIAVPESEDGLRKAFGEAHRRYTNLINRRMNWNGYLWQGRFKSYVVDHHYLLTAVRYIELNPVRARIVAKPEDWKWSSARAHCHRKNDRLCTVEPLMEMVDGPWRKFLYTPLAEFDIAILRSSERTGRPLGNREFMEELEELLHRQLLPKKRGRKSQNTK